LLTPPTQLLRKNPSARLGAGKRGIEEIKQHGFFRKINWTALALKVTTPPIAPNVVTAEDTSNFARAFTDLPIDSPPEEVPHWDVQRSGGNAVNGLEDAFQGFSFVNSYLVQN
jgi:hypothetical protein